MNWVQELLDLYDKNEDIAGEMMYLEQKTKKGVVKIPIVLLPVSHTTVLAQITVTIDETGDFLKAETVAEEDRITIIPVTEKSGSRTDVAPHPLCDNLKYLAGDYMKYYAGKAGKEKDFSRNHELFMQALQAWNDSEFHHIKAQAVYRYLEKGCLIRDLVENGIVELNESGKMKEDVKILGILQTDAFVRWRIEEAKELQPGILEDDAGSCLSECWLDKSLFQSFIRYYETCTVEKGLSYLTGNTEAVSYLHPKKIRNEGDGGKLFSSNDKTYFTFRGRFTDKSQAIAIGYTDSQKIHNALKWIIRKQGYAWDDLTVVVWASEMQPLPDMREDTDAICEKAEEILTDEDIGWPDRDEACEEESGYDEPAGWGEEEEEEHIYDTDEPGALRFKAAMRGYEKQFDRMSRTVLLALTSATPGRVSMAENRVLLSSHYIENLAYWHDSCRWLHTKYKDGRRIIYTGMKGIDALARALYGTEQKGVLTLANNKVCGELYKRLLPCMIDRKKVPEDLVRLAVYRASSPVSFKEWYNWESVLETACAFVKKQYYDRDPKEEWRVALDKECDKRDYLYGRLLAAAYYVEFRTYTKEERRETNAQRYMTAFSQRPMQTWKIIEEKLAPYWQRLRTGESIKYRKLLEEIYDKFSVETFEDDRPLGGLYLLGFHSQITALRNYQEVQTEDGEAEEQE